jgi:hypothetical protein
LAAAGTASDCAELGTRYRQGLVRDTGLPDHRNTDAAPEPVQSVDGDSPAVDELGGTLGIALGIVLAIAGNDLDRAAADAAVRVDVVLGRRTRILDLRSDADRVVVGVQHADHDRVGRRGGLATRRQHSRIGGGSAGAAVAARAALLACTAGAARDEKAAGSDERGDGEGGFAMSGRTVCPVRSCVPVGRNNHESIHEPPLEIVLRNAYSVVCSATITVLLLESRVREHHPRS